MQLPSNVRLIEVGPRDGLQNEPRPLPTCDKVDLVERLVGVGVREIELTSFVNPKLVPNLADADQIMAATRGLRAQRFALILNAKGYERALQAGAEALTVTLSLTDSHNKQNANRTTHQSVTELGPLGARSRADGLTARVAISMAFGCAFDGAVELTKLQSVIGAMVDGGFRRVVLCDTIGVAHPRQVYDWSQRCLADFPGVQFDLHLHDTYGRGLANILAALEAGVTTFDTAIGGLGGCPFAAGATGNVATEDVVALLESMGIQTGIDLDGMIDLSIRTLAQLGQPRRSHLSLARVQPRVAEGAEWSSASASWNAAVDI